MTPLAQGARTWTELFGIASCGISMSYIASMIMQGLFDKWPDLRVILKEGGFWWLPEFQARADDFYLNHPGDIQLCERMLEQLHVLQAELGFALSEVDISGVSLQFTGASSKKIPSTR